MLTSEKQYQGRLRLRTVFLIVSLVVLVLPLGSIFFFRIYENELVRQTELSLISQAAVIAASYKQQVVNLVEAKSSYGVKINREAKPKIDNYYTPIYPQIDLAKNKSLPSRPDGITSTTHPDGVAIQAGKILAAILRDSQKTTLTGIRLLDYNGNVIAGRSELGLSFAHISEIKTAMQGHYASVIRQRISDEPPPALASISRGTGIRVFVALPIIHNGRLWGVVYLSRTPKNILKHLYAEKDKVILAGATIVVLTFLLALFTSYAISQPIYRLIKKTTRVSEGDHQSMEPLEYPVTKELELLSKSFSKMAKSLHQRSEYIREFAAHVSHELKTPLTSIQGAAELLMDHIDDMEHATKQQFLSNIQQDTDRLKRLVTRLLELARADSQTSDNETADLMVVLNKLSSRHQATGLQVELPKQHNCWVRITADNLETILINLFDNAKQHDASAVNISLKVNNQLVELIITDNGSGISQANRDKIFTPFFTTRREQSGTGLGLSIIKSLMEACQGSIRLADTEKGSSFILQFRKAGH
ncbi:GAF domain-containing sensor histidine kinase [Endozoicomonas sp. SM1973]|uniref:histidine kinase n=1 Tax=Spartinivicinus marinus TaxID=2994442 RepID=A0A853I9X2_9GAMM|nr:HAMP domain-containing sensor histidine kinase [Spartinivicinus marinus]MCX4027641.1 HAMP domain-containing sensor histidine kinase [Spartinivicinus marinus]NYZ66661.1 GAF domain-containing sensor histidine kinase [Spartinivicinus marinus]